MNKAKSKWTVDDKKMQIIVPLGLPVELLTGDAEAMTDAHGRLRIGSYNLQKEIGTLCKQLHYIALASFGLQSGLAINFMGYSLRTIQGQ